MGETAPKGKKRHKRPPPKEKELADLSQPDGDLFLTVFEPDDGLRIDAFLAERMPWRSRTKLVDLLAEGIVLVNGTVVTKPSKRVAQRDVVQVLVPKQEFAQDPREIPLHVIYEDSHLLALSKQAGLVCHPVGSIREGTLMNALHARFRDTERKERDVVPRLCHRLDRDTSGIILVALSEQVRRRMQWIFEAKVVCKEYLAIVHGVWEASYDECHLPLRRAGEDAEVHISVMVDEKDGAPSRTIFIPEERFPPHDGDRGFTLVRCAPVTGRQHQIRVHALAKGHPVLGDNLYGGADHRGGFGFPSEAPLLRRQALHAYRIQLPHPIREGVELDIRAPLFPDMAETLAWLRARKRGAAGSAGEAEAPPSAPRTLAAPMRHQHPKEAAS